MTEEGPRRRHITVGRYTFSRAGSARLVDVVRGCLATA